MSNLENIIFKDLIYKLIDNKIDKINVNKDTFKDITDEDFNTFLNALKLNNSIKTFKLNRCNLSQEQYDKIFNILQFNKNILKFSLEDYKLVFYPEFNKLISNLNEIKQLNIINDNNDILINFQNKIIQDIINKKIPLYNFIQNNNLKSLTFNIDDSINQLFIEKILFNVLINNKSITNINLSETLNLKKLKDYLNFNNNISNLSIICYLKYINETDFENFCKYIEQNKSLKHLNIYSVIKEGIPKDKIIFVKNKLFKALINNQYIDSIIFKGESFIIEDTYIDWDLIINLLQNNNRIKKLFFNIDLSNNINSFLEYLQTNNSLQKLKIKCIDYNPRLLALVIKNNKTLEYLDLSDSKFSNIDLMLEFLKTNTTLKYLNLKNVSFTDEYYTKDIVNSMINEVLECNKVIKIIY